MLTKKLFCLLVLFSVCNAQNILNFLDFAAPLFGLLKAGTPEVCYNELGCFRNDGPFSRSPIRPISCVPQSPQVIGTEFYVYSRNNPNDPQVIDAIDTELFDTIEFNPNLSTKLVVHGYKERLLVQGFDHDTFEAVKDGLLHNEDSNVILVRWNRGASGFYFQSVANCRVVAAQIALLINTLIRERNGRPELFHMIGFSLGSHICGYVGKLVPNLGRITAIDAAKPYFNGVPKIVRLDSSDALFVEGLHSDNGIGTEDQMGHVDIYFNGGDHQPGCDRQIIDKIANDGPIDGFFEIISCDHKRSLHYYADFLLRANSECIPIAYRCESWNKFMSGHCSTCGQNGEDCAIVGLNTGLNPQINRLKRENNKYFMATNDRHPFCVYQYLVRIEVNPTKSRIDGKFNLRIFSFNNTFIDFKSRQLEVRTQRMASFVISSDKPLNDIRKIDLIFTQQSSLENNREHRVRIHSMQLIPLNLIDDNEKIRNTMTYCTDGRKWLANRDESLISLQNRHCIIQSNLWNNSIL